uniref:Uncharacterized protein n=1 Tax=Rhizophora mucronata TaxID=61149 RepID=A0A2P2NBY3_RHIMU
MHNWFNHPYLILIGGSYSFKNCFSPRRHTEEKQISKDSIEMGTQR